MLSKWFCCLNNKKSKKIRHNPTKSTFSNLEKKNTSDNVLPDTKDKIPTGRARCYTVKRTASGIRLPSNILIKSFDMKVVEKTGEKILKVGKIHRQMKRLATIDLD